MKTYIFHNHHMAIPHYELPEGRLTQQSGVRIIDCFGRHMYHCTLGTYNDDSFIIETTHLSGNIVKYRLDRKEWHTLETDLVGYLAYLEKRSVYTGPFT